MHRPALLAAVLALASTSANAAQSAATYPERPIRLVIGSASGSGPDIIARVLSERLYKSWGQRIVVDARPGVAGALSAEIVHRAAPDGYTWLMMTSQLFIATKVYKDLKFDLERDFASVGLIGSVPYVLTVNAQLPAKSVAELIELSKKTKLRHGSAGPGGGEHLCMVYFLTSANVQMLHVPYKGIAQALADVAGREIHTTFAVVPAAMPFVQGGRLRALGVSTMKRAPLLPDIPPISDTVPGFNNFGWYSIIAPIGVPPAILEKVSAEMVKAIKEPEFGETLRVLGIDIIGGTRAQLDAFRKSEDKRMGDIVKAANLDVK
ncbi:MAG TPA: tripartite tricarboxylate transporter substrate-binding protein [Burkholderiales bacterium]|nr:tripartite tricarboxylate transporter substrate-binding protein [Burkholderiales bacterium]